MQVKTITHKILNQPTMVNLLRNYSRTSIPSIFRDDPFRRHRQFLSEFWNAPDPFDVISPMQKFMGYRMPSMNYNWEDERMDSNPTDGFSVSLNVGHFSPNEINVKVVDKSIVVEAKHEERAENGEGYISRHFTRRYVLPDEFNVKDIVSTLSSDGILTVRVPPKQIDPASVRNIHIQQTGVPSSAHHPGQIKGPEQNQTQEMNQMKNEPKDKN